MKKNAKIPFLPLAHFFEESERSSPPEILRSNAQVNHAFPELLYKKKDEIIPRKNDFLQIDGRFLMAGFKFGFNNKKEMRIVLDIESASPRYFLNCPYSLIM